MMQINKFAVAQNEKSLNLPVGWALYYIVNVNADFSILETII